MIDLVIIVLGFGPLLSNGAMTYAAALVISMEGISKLASTTYQEVSYTVRISRHQHLAINLSVHVPHFTKLRFASLRQKIIPGADGYSQGFSLAKYFSNLIR